MGGSGKDIIISSSNSSSSSSSSSRVGGDSSSEYLNGTIIVDLHRNHQYLHYSSD